MKKLLILVVVTLLMLVSGMGLHAQTIPTASVTSENAYDIVGDVTNPEELSAEEAQKYNDTQKKDNGDLDNEFYLNGSDGYVYVEEGETTSEGSTSNTADVNGGSNESDMTWAEAFSHFAINMETVDMDKVYNLAFEPALITPEDGKRMFSNYVHNVAWLIFMGAIIFLIFGGLFKVLQAIFDDKKSTLGAIVLGAVIIFVLVPILINFPEFMAWCGDFVNELMTTEMGAW